MEAKSVLLIVIIVVLIYIVYGYISKDVSTLSGLTSGQTMQTINATSLTSSSTTSGNTGNFTYSIWCYIDDWNYRYGEEKVVFGRMVSGSNPLQPCPSVILGALENNLIVSLTVFPGLDSEPLTGATTSGTATSGTAVLTYVGLANVENLNYGGVSLATTVSIETQAVMMPVPGEKAPKVLPAQIIVSAGVNGFSGSSNFTALGFAEGVYGGESGLDATSPRVGRLSFQIGASAGQTIHIDLGDFGSKGPITGAITADVDDPNHPVNIATSAAAKNVLSILDGAMDSVNATRASMGAIMNRMQQVITNLSNVGTNASASRSQIEDADYAKASSDMARAQIIAQAATAVLAQANTSQQTVLKLLQG